ncbi:hypothetical protein BDK92_7483 [Micromonospora pisi]|uniref:Uncharacterized protein n=1 Tax=Micromonospora pisi TaxID=589240 RepID=A0A495JVD1_9ACTN|nr:hypothetical protein [Micromonospora pisi]RKR92987.1 hypothetical protein BDK92_7483 [Micromonospora pisi]
MIVRLLVAGVSALAGIMVLGGCWSEDEPQSGHKVSVDAVRQAAIQIDPARCPIKLDLSAALRSVAVDRPAQLDSASAEVSKSEKPADDPVTAQQNGLPPLEAAAATYVECDYRVGEDKLGIRLTATRAPAAISLLAPQIARDAHLTLQDLQGFLDSPPGAGQVKVAGGTVAAGGVAADGGDVAMLVSSTVPELHDDTLSTFTAELINQVAF